VVNTPPEILSVTPLSQSVQYSDAITPIEIVVFDTGPAPLTLTPSAAVPSALSLSPAGAQDPTTDCTAVTGGFECTWTISGQMLVAAGTNDIDLTASDGSLSSDPATATVNVTTEDVVVRFDPANPVSVEAPPGEDSGPFSLSVEVTEFDDPNNVLGDSNLAGNISLASVAVQLVPVGPGPTVGPILCVDPLTPGLVDPDSPFNYDVLTVACSFDDVPVNTYSVQATVNLGGFYAGTGEDVLTIFDPSLGFTTGGGWFYWPGTEDPANGHLGDRTNFGYNMKYNKKQTNVKGSLLLIRHLADGSIYRIKSNALTGLAVGESSDAGGTFGWAAFTGKVTFKAPGEDAVGNHTFTVYVEDRGEPGSGADRFWLQVRDQSGDIVPDLSLDVSASANAETIGGGNIVVPHAADKGPGGP
jgi:hypothetical protein